MGFAWVPTAVQPECCAPLRLPPVFNASVLLQDCKLNMTWVASALSCSCLGKREWGYGIGG